MFKRLCRWWFKLNGWRVVNNIPDRTTPDEIQKYVMIGAPHTSNWDFIIGMATVDIMKLPVRFTIKKEWMFFPLNLFFRHMGAIAIDRTPKPGVPHKNMVLTMAHLLQESTEELVIVITPEGTRSRREKWKSGFYHVAKHAGVPILLGYIDYRKKECGVKEIFCPTDDKEADMRHIMAFYQPVTAKHPELFSVDRDYV